jgi:hypothetical protein
MLLAIRCCGTIPHDVDVNTQVEAAVGGQGPSGRS